EDSCLTKTSTWQQSRQSLAIASSEPIIGCHGGFAATFDVSNSSPWGSQSSWAAQHGKASESHCLAVRTSCYRPTLLLLSKVHTSCTRSKLRSRRPTDWHAPAASTR